MVVKVLRHSGEAVVCRVLDEVREGSEDFGGDRAELGLGARVRVVVDRIARRNGVCVLIAVRRRSVGDCSVAVSSVNHDKAVGELLVGGVCHCVLLVGLCACAVKSHRVGLRHLPEIDFAVCRGAPVLLHVLGRFVHC